MHIIITAEVGATPWLGKGARGELPGDKKKAVAEEREEKEKEEKEEEERQCN